MKGFIKTKETGVIYRESTEKRHLGKPDRCFYVRINMRGFKPVFEKVGWASEGYTAKHAAVIRGDKIRAMRHGEYVEKEDQKTLTFRSAWGEYKTSSSVNIKASSLMIYESTVNVHILGAFGNTPLEKITRLDIEKLKNDMTSAGSAPATVNKVLAIMALVINFTIKHGLWNGPSPMKGVKFLKVDNKRTRFLSVEEAKSVFDTLLNGSAKFNKDLHDAALVALRCGLRVSEVFKLTWADVNLENGTVRLRDRKHGSGYAYMTEDIEAIFKERNLVGVKPFDRIFYMYTNVRSLAQSFNMVVDAAGFNSGVTDSRDKVVFHTLRHTFASWLASQGESLYVIKNLMGHSDIKMTERYAHLCPSTERAAVQRMMDRWTLS